LVNGFPIFNYFDNFNHFLDFSSKFHSWVQLFFIFFSICFEIYFFHPFFRLIEGTKLSYGKPSDLELNPYRVWS
jgi:hypothetical protein